MIQINSLAFGYPSSPLLFNGLDLKIKQGESWAILGQSGYGKTTLLLLLAGLLRPTTGSILIHGELLERTRPSTGLILQDYGLLPWATVGQNAELGLRVREFYGPDGRHSPPDFEPSQSSSSWLQRLGIADVAEKYPSQISGGQRQRTAIARTLAIQPDLLLMDEPFSSLDAVTRKDLQSLTLKLCEENEITLVMVTHSVEEALLMGSKILVIPQSPDQAAEVIDNPHRAEDGYRNSSDYLERSEDLFALLSANETA